MPGRLDPGAWCPQCGKDIDVLDRTINAQGTRMEFWHTDGQGKCEMFDPEHAKADRLHARLHGQKVKE